MPRPSLRFALACLLFAGWVGYLIYLVVTAAHPVVVSRPQILAARLVIVARVDNLADPVEVREVLRVKGDVKLPEVGAKIHVANLGKCRRSPGEGKTIEQMPLDWTGPGEYLLPLEPLSADGKEYLVSLVPASPGFPPSRSTPRLYPRTDETLRQLRGIEAQ